MLLRKRLEIFPSNIPFELLDNIFREMRQKVVNERLSPTIFKPELIVTDLLLNRVSIVMNSRILSFVVSDIENVYLLTLLLCLIDSPDMVASFSIV